MFTGLRQRLISLFIILTLGPVLIITLVVGTRNFVIYEEQSLVIQSQAAAKVRSEVEGFFSAKAAELEQLDSIIDLGTMSIDDQRIILGNVLFTGNDYHGITLLDRKGFERIRLSRTDVFLQDDLGSRAATSAFADVVDGGITGFSATYFDSVCNEPLINISVPLFDKWRGELAGVVTAELRFKKVWDLLSSPEMPSNQEVYVVNSDGSVVAHRNPSVVLRGTIVEVPEADGRTVDINGTAVIAASSTIDLGNNSLTVVSQQLLTDALYTAYRGLRISITVTAIALVAGLVFLLIVIRQGMHPIKELADYAHTISTGDFSKKLNLPPLRRELGQLEQALRSMAEALRKRDEVMQMHSSELKRSRDQLEQMVSERTADLAESNRLLREERDRARRYFDIAGSMLVVLNRKGEVELINTAGKQLLGYHDDEITGKNWFDLVIPKESMDAVRKVFYDVMDGCDALSEYHENPVITKYGEEKLVGWHNTLLLDKSGAEQGTLSSGVDLTERRKMEGELAKIQKLESLGVLAGGIAHDFNNILTAVLGSISLAKEEIARGTGMSGDTLNAAERACVQLRDLNRQLLTFSQGGTPIKKPSYIGALVKDACGLALRGTNAVCEYSLPADLWPADVDPGQIGQVVNNLVINAIQAMPSGGTLYVSGENYTAPDKSVQMLPSGKYVKLTIRDEGGGIAKEHLRSIFDPFFTTKGQGSGLGLATTYSIIKRHGGHITAESEPGRGAIFSIYLIASEKIPTEGERSKEEPLSGEGKILIMDDQSGVREILKKMLERIGYTVETAEEGGAAVRCYREAMETDGPVDAVILDLTVPGGMGGRETIEELLRIDPEVKAIVSSGYSNDQTLSDYISFGFSGVISKPYNLRELSEVLSKIVGRAIQRELL